MIVYPLFLFFVPYCIFNIVVFSLSHLKYIIESLVGFKLSLKLNMAKV